MIVLAFDTSVTGCAVALYNSITGKVSLQRMDTERGQAEHLVPLIDKIIRDEGFTFSEISRIHTTSGPGSFTGVRIGLATATGLALALQKKLYAFSTLDILAAAQNLTSSNCLIIIDTKRGDFYGQLFNGNEAIGQARIWSLDEVARFDGMVIQDEVPDTAVLAQMPVEKAQNNLNPIYLRGAEVSQSKNLPPKII